MEKEEEVVVSVQNLMIKRWTPLLWPLCHFTHLSVNRDNAKPWKVIYSMIQTHVELQGHVSKLNDKNLKNLSLHAANQHLLDIFVTKLG